MNNREAILKQISFLFIVLAAIFLSLREIYGEDIPFHLNAGRWILENMSFPDKDQFTYIASGHDYIDMNWFYQVFMYGIYSVGGAVALVIANALLVLASVILLFKRCAGSHSVFLPWLLLIAVLTISPILEIRPHSVSWLLMSLVFYVLEEFKNGNKKIIRWLPVTVLVWVNCHSLFILGLAVTGCYGVFFLFKKKELFHEYVRWGAVAVFACFLNPYGWNGFAFPFEQLMSLQAGDAFKENIRELQSPFEITEYEANFKNLFGKWHFFDLFLVLALVGLARQIKKLQVHEWLISIIFFYFAATATKNIGYFVFAVTPIVARGFIGVQHQPQKPGKKTKDKPLPFLTRYAFQVNIGFLLLTTMLILGIRTNAFYIHYRAIYRFGWGWSESNLPVKATQFLIDHKLTGKMLNQLDLGGYLEFMTRQKVSMDGRLEVMGKKLFAEQVNATTPEAKVKLLEKYNPDIVMFAYYITPDWIRFFTTNPNWRLAYVDGSHAIYLRNGYAPEVKVVDDKIFTAGIPEYTDAKIDALIRDKRDDNFFQKLFKSQYYPEEELNQAFFSFYYRWVPAAKQVTAKGFEKASCGYPECYQNLGTIYYEYKDKERALLCYQKYLEQVKNEHVQKRVDFLKSL